VSETCEGERGKAPRGRGSDGRTLLRARLADVALPLADELLCEVGDLLDVVVAQLVYGDADLGFLQGGRWRVSRGGGEGGGGGGQRRARETDPQELVGGDDLGLELLEDRDGLLRGANSVE